MRRMSLLAKAPEIALMTVLDLLTAHILNNDVSINLMIMRRMLLEPFDSIMYFFARL